VRIPPSPSNNLPYVMSPSKLPLHFPINFPLLYLFPSIRSSFPFGERQFYFHFSARIKINFQGNERQPFDRGLPNQLFDFLLMEQKPACPCRFLNHMKRSE